MLLHFLLAVNKSLRRGLHEEIIRMTTFGVRMVTSISSKESVESCRMHAKRLRFSLRSVPMCLPLTLAYYVHLLEHLCRYLCTRVLVCSFISFVALYLLVPLLPMLLYAEIAIYLKHNLKWTWAIG